MLPGGHTWVSARKRRAAGGFPGFAEKKQRVTGAGTPDFIRYPKAGLAAGAQRGAAQWRAMNSAWVGMASQLTRTASRMVFIRRPRVAPSVASASGS